MQSSKAITSRACHFGSYLDGDELSWVDADGGQIQGGSNKRGERPSALEKGHRAQKVAATSVAMATATAANAASARVVESGIVILACCT
ncbi:MAG: hypothetical protein Q6373_017940 [Candidatus Sigynarchaeota archaeon]